MKRTETDRKTRDGEVVLSRGEAEHLRAAILQMDLLLGSRQEEAALRHLVALLLHMRAFSPAVA